MSVKLQYTTAEVCDMVDVKASTLRAWERDFPQLTPKRNKSGGRIYKDKDIELVRYIKHLLINEKYTVDGAKRRIALERRAKRYGIEIKEEELELPEALQESGDVFDDYVESVEEELPAPTAPKKSAEKNNDALLKTIRDEIFEMLEILK